MNKPLMANIQMRILLWGLLCGSTLLSACTDKDGLTIEDKVEEISYKTGNDLSVTHTLTWERPWKDEKFQMLGYGYDATGKYAHPSSVRAKIIDMHQMNESRIIFNRSTSNGPTPLRTGTPEQFVKALAANMHIDKEELSKYKNLFRGSFADIFVADTTTYHNLEYLYAYVSQQVVMHTYYFDPVHLKYISAAELNAHLSPQFREDLLKKSAEDIISKYGTHVLQQTVLGRRVDYVYRHTPYESHDAQYWFMSRIRENFNIFPGVIIWPNNADAASPAKENLYMEVVDNVTAKPNAWMIDVTNYNGTRIEYKDWYKDHDPNEATLIDIDFGNNLPGIIPIYEFVTDPVKKKEIQVAVERYLSE